jgi:hypothetical protein
MSDVGEGMLAVLTLWVLGYTVGLVTRAVRNF